MTARRAFLAAVAALGAVRAVAQSPPKVPVVGFLTSGGVDTFAQFRDAMRDLGYTEGRDLVIVRRSSEGNPQGLPVLAAELVRMNVDVIYAAGPVAVKAARGATSRIPIVALDLETDPVAAGLVASLGRPGGNVTGLFLDQPALAGKWLELLAEAVPATKRVGVVWDAGTGTAQLAAARAAAQRLRMDARVVEFRTVDGMFAALRATAEGRVQALAMLTSPLVYSSSKGLAEWVTKTKMPAISPFRAFADAGGLMSYGPDLLVFRRFSATYVDRILKGAAPGELPIQQPARFQFVVNQRAAKALGVVLPQALLLRADEVIK